MYHNSNQNRAYQPMLSLIWNGKLQGRIDHPLMDVYPNIGLDGVLRDLSDLKFARDLAKDRGKEAYDLMTVEGIPHRDYFYFFFNELGKLILQERILLVKRLHSRGEINFEDEDLIQKIAELFRESHFIILEEVLEATRAELPLGIDQSTDWE